MLPPQPKNYKISSAFSYNFRLALTISDTYQLFERWRGDMLQRLTACFREGHFALQSLKTPADLDRLTEGQALAIQWQSTIEYWTDCLLSGDMTVQMDIFRDRKGVEARCDRILNLMQTKSGAA